VTKPVLLVRAAGNAADAAALAKLGISSVSEPYLDIHAIAGPTGTEAAARLLDGLGRLGSGDWVVATSLNALVFWRQIVTQSFEPNLDQNLAFIPGQEQLQPVGPNLDQIRHQTLAPKNESNPESLSMALQAAKARGVRFAAIGEATAKKYSEMGIHQVLTPAVSTAAGLAEMLLALAPVRAAGKTPTALIPLGNLAMPTLTTALDAAGWQRITEVVYDTQTVANRPASASGLRSGDFAAVLLRSPSAARAVAHHTGMDQRQTGMDQGNPATAATAIAATAIAVPVICGGETTAATARALGFNVQAIAPATTADATAQAIFEVLQKTGDIDPHRPNPAKPHPAHPSEGS
jgi:uroporphyrinogen-III synthase